MDRRVQPASMGFRSTALGVSAWLSVSARGGAVTSDLANEGVTGAPAPAESVPAFQLRRLPVRRRRRRGGRRHGFPGAGHAARARGNVAVGRELPRSAGRRVGAVPAAGTTVLENVTLDAHRNRLRFELVSYLQSPPFVAKYDLHRCP